MNMATPNNVQGSPLRRHDEDEDEVDELIANYIADNSPQKAIPVSPTLSKPSPPRGPPPGLALLAFNGSPPGPPSAFIAPFRPKVFPTAGSPPAGPPPAPGNMVALSPASASTKKQSTTTGIAADDMPLTFASPNEKDSGEENMQKEKKKGKKKKKEKKEKKEKEKKKSKEMNFEELHVQLSRTPEGETRESKSKDKIDDKEKDKDEKVRSKNKTKTIIPSSAVSDTEQTNLAAELEKIRWRREMARLKRENEELKRQLVITAEKESYKQREAAERSEERRIAAANSSVQTQDASEDEDEDDNRLVHEEAETLAVPRPPMGPPPNVQANQANSTANSNSLGLGAVWNYLRSAATSLASHAEKPAIATDTNTFPKHMLERRRPPPIAGGALQRSTLGTDNATHVPQSEKILTPLPILLNGRNTVWRLPFNGKGPAEKRILTIALYLDAKDSHMTNGNFLDGCFMDVLRMSQERHSSHDQNAVLVRLPLTLRWYDIRAAGGKSAETYGAVRELIIQAGSTVSIGHVTAAFQKKLRKGETVPRPEVCFSLVTATRSLDLAVDSPHEAHAWVSSLQYLVQLADSLSNQEARMHTPDKVEKLHIDIDPREKPATPTSTPPSPTFATLYSMSSVESPNSSHSMPSKSGSPGFEGQSMISSMASNRPTYSASPSPTPDSFVGSNPMNTISPARRISAGGTGGTPLPRGVSFKSLHAPASVREERIRDFIAQNSVSKGKLASAAETAAGAGAAGKGSVPTRASWKERLFGAAQSGDIDVFEGVLAGGAPIDTPIGTDVSSTSHLQSLQGLLSNVGPGSSHAWDTPLIVASRHGFINIINACLRAGAKNDPFGQGTTALHAAVTARQYDAAATILQSAARAGADSTICDIIDSDGTSALHAAAGLLSGADAASGGAKESLRLLELLISHGANLHLLDGTGRTCLHIATDAGSVEAQQLLLDYDDSLINGVDNDGNTALLIAVARNDVECVRVLLQSAANPYIKSKKFGKNALDLAVSKSFTKLGVLLLEYRSYVDENGVEGSEDITTTVAGNSDSDGISLVQSGAEVESEIQRLHDAYNTQSTFDDYSENGADDVAVDRFSLQGRDWQVFLTKEDAQDNESFATEIPYFVDEEGNSTWDDPRDFVENNEHANDDDDNDDGDEAVDSQSWLHGEPPETVPVYLSYPVTAESHVEFYLRKRRSTDVDAYFAAIEASRDHLSRTLPSRAVPESFLESKAMIDVSLEQWETRTAFQYFIWEPLPTIDQRDQAEGNGERLIGSIALFNRHAPHSLEVGFWIAESHSRRGIATRASIAIMRMAFDTFSLPPKSTSRTNTNKDGNSRTLEAATSDLKSIELYHDKLMERQSGGIARKIGFLREEEIPFEPAASKAPSSLILVRWAYPTERRQRLDLVKVGTEK